SEHRRMTTCEDAVTTRPETARETAKAIAKRHGLDAKQATPALVEAYESGRRAAYRARLQPRDPAEGDARVFGYFEDEKPIVAQMLRLDRQGLSLSAIASALNDERLHRRDGTPWTRNAVHRVLERQRTDCLRGAPPAT